MDGGCGMGGKRSISFSEKKPRRAGASRNRKTSRPDFRPNASASLDTDVENGQAVVVIAQNKKAAALSPVTLISQRLGFPLINRDSADRVLFARAKPQACRSPFNPTCSALAEEIRRWPAESGATIYLLLGRAGFEPANILGGCGR
jgi:hypothetical protein